VRLAAPRARSVTPDLENRTLREISAKLAEAEHLNVNGKPFAAASVQSMVQKARPS
jgi:hypothetical protein